MIELRNYFLIDSFALCRSILVVSNYIGFNFKVLVSIKTNKVSFFLSVTSFSLVSLCCLARKIKGALLCILGCSLSCSVFYRVLFM